MVVIHGLRRSGVLPKSTLPGRFTVRRDRTTDVMQSDMLMRSMQCYLKRIYTQLQMNVNKGEKAQLRLDQNQWHD